MPIIADRISQLAPPNELDLWRAKAHWRNSSLRPEAVPGYEGVPVDALAVLWGAMRQGGVQRVLGESVADPFDYADAVKEVSNACIEYAIALTGIEMTDKVDHLTGGLVPFLDAIVVNHSMEAEAANG
jgi:hypothetical protein